MKATRHAALRLVQGERRAAREKDTDWLVFAFVALALVALVLVSLSSFSSERRAIRSLPGAERAALVSRTVDELRELCGDGRPDGLKDHCRELAAFASKFDECRGDCAALARAQLAPVPTR
jgi:hypothetical protein